MITGAIQSKVVMLLREKGAVCVAVGVESVYYASCSPPVFIPSGFPARSASP